MKRGGPELKKRHQRGLRFHPLFMHEFIPSIYQTRDIRANNTGGNKMLQFLSS